MVLFWTLVTVAAVAAAVDWLAVGRADLRLEMAAKPAVLVALTVAAGALPPVHTDLVHRRWYFVAALTCCLVGDVLLMLPRDLFVPGLIAFLAGHVAYIVGFLQPPEPRGITPFSFSVTGLVVASLAVAAAEAVPFVVIVRSLVDSGHRPLLVPVLVYVCAIAAMVVLACNVGIAWAAIGAVLFLVSDTALAVDRFARRSAHGKLVVHITYHIAQVLLVVSLVR